MMKYKYIYWMLAVALLLGGCQWQDGRSGVAETPEETQNTRPNVSEHNTSLWYIRIRAENMTHGLIASDAQLGVLDESNTTQKHALQAFPPMGTHYVDVVFRDPEGVAAGEYKTYFLKSGEESVYRWGFTVRTTDSHARMMLSWRGLYTLEPYRDETGRQRYRESKNINDPILAHMYLRDVQTGSIFPALSGGQPKKYYFGMNGVRERVFEWIYDSNGSMQSVNEK